MGHMIEIPDDEEAAQQALKHAIRMGNFCLTWLKRDQANAIANAKRAAHYARKYMMYKALTDNKEI